MNKVILIGNLVRDPGLRQTQTGKSVVEFTVATSNGKDAEGKDRPADFTTCKAWNKQAEMIAKWFTKGKQICVTGSLKTDKYVDKKHEDVTHYNSYVQVSEVEFVGTKGGTAQPTQAAPAPAAETPTAAEETSNEDCPF